ncbi:HNH endonuclease [Roseibium litorale]|uniref:HNH endonuclease 5 domain-containing protein n=1 Tax=Roseibium litorale TaxID=2803841 RepID=A0ABR9CJ19_9HYPH|nr:HNH endonuclease [Roseibium litorale]MBD8890306.1 hypothetical protein [Roseibium litorale]
MTKHFPGHGTCIYCGTSGVTLTKEHIVPEFIGGQTILDDASCLKCNEVTNKFETDVARKMWGDARTAYRAPSKKKSYRHKKNLDLRTFYPNAPSKKIPYEELPAIFVFYKPTPSGLLSGLPETFNIMNQWKLIAISDNTRSSKFKEKYGYDAPARFISTPDSFLKMIAKIGYGQVLTSLAPSEFEPICLPYILGQKENPSFIVGGDPEIHPPEKDNGYRLSHMAFGTRDQLLLVAEVRLLANEHTPTYHVVVGYVHGVDAVQNIRNKWGSESLATFARAPDGSLLPKAVPTQPTPTSQAHWQPQIWPLPYLTGRAKEAVCHKPNYVVQLTQGT